MKRLNIFATGALLMLFASIFTACTSLYYGTQSIQGNYDNPEWAPSYYGARYYYIPDIEAYYDLSSHNFIFLNDGRWCYSRSLSMIYPDFSLDNCFTVILNINVYKPWMHHQYYVSHYPRYYYRDYYDHSNIPYVRGYNENSRSAVYWKENERNKARKWDGDNVKDNRGFKYSREDRQQQKLTDRQYPENINRGKNEEAKRSRDYGNDNRSNQVSTRQTQERTSDQVRSGQVRDNSSKEQYSTRSSSSQNQSRRDDGNTEINNRTNYYGRTIGNSVKVTRQMREKDNVNRSSEKRNKSDNSGRRNENRSNKNNGRR